MRLYWQFAKLRFMSEIVYRANVIAFFITQTVWMVGYFFLWTAVYQGGNTLGNYDLKSILTYSILTSVFQIWSLTRVGVETARLIVEGSLNMYLIKPLGFLRAQVVTALGRSGIDLACGAILIALVFMFFSSALVPLTAVHVAIGLVMLAFGIALVMLCSLVIGLLGFWTSKVDGIWVMFFFIVSFLSGDYLPVDIFPASFQHVLMYLPFQYTMWFPLQIIMGRIEFPAAWPYVWVMLAWVVGLACVCRLMWRRGLRRYEAVSG